MAGHIYRMKHKKNFLARKEIMSDLRSVTRRQEEFRDLHRVPKKSHLEKLCAHVAGVFLESTCSAFSIPLNILVESTNNDLYIVLSTLYLKCRLLY